MLENHVPGGQPLVSHSYPLIIFNSVTKRYKNIIALSDCNFSVPPKRIVGLVGPNGAGKTTIMRLISGEIKPDFGDVVVFGMKPLNNPLVTSRLGIINDIDFFYPKMTARLLGLTLLKTRFPREQASALLTKMMQEMDIFEFIDKPLGTYSKGMRQRFKLAMALAHDPEILIADEPFNGLDPLARKFMYDKFKELRNQGKTLLLSSHILWELEKLIDHLTLIYLGRVIAEGRPSDIRIHLQEMPHQVLVETPEASTLAHLLVDLMPVPVKSISQGFNQRSGTPQLVLYTTNPQQLYEFLTKVVVEEKITILRLQNLDDNLQRIFDLLTT